MRRREFIKLSGAALVAAPLPAVAQDRIYRVGHFANSPIAEKLTREVTLPELARQGFVEGRNLVVDFRIGLDISALQASIREMIDARPDAIIAVGPAPLSVAAAATRAVPIVAFGADPVEIGLAQTHARPGGNVTGVAILTRELEGKRLSFLLETIPGRRRIAVLLSATGNPASEPALRSAAKRLAVDMLPFTISGPSDYPAAFAAMQAAGADALVISASPELFRDGEQLARLALATGLPTVCEWAEMASTGCMIGYGPNRAALRRRMGAQVAQILRGTGPGEIAIELPSAFEFAINQKVARQLGISIPLAVLANADEVIE